MCGNKESDPGQWQERDSSPGVGTIYTMAFDFRKLANVFDWRDETFPNLVPEFRNTYLPPHVHFLGILRFMSRLKVLSLNSHDASFHIKNIPASAIDKTHHTDMRGSGKFSFVEWPASAQTSRFCFVLWTRINLNLISWNVYIYILNVWIGCYLELSTKNNID